MISLLCGDCIEKMQTITDRSVDGVITSPPYNTSRSGRTDKYNSRYTNRDDSKTNAEYILWQVEMFNTLSAKLKDGGSVLYNINYGSENTETIWLLIAAILRDTGFTVADQIIWKKQNAIPNNRSKNKLTRITENIFVFVKKDDFETFHANKKVKSVIEKTGQKNYENVFNFIEAPNRDRGEHTVTHKATYSTTLCEKLIEMYYAPESLLLDPFMGTGTTGIAAINKNCKFIGVEIDEGYFKIAAQRTNTASFKRLLWGEL